MEYILRIDEEVKKGGISDKRLEDLGKILTRAQDLTMFCAENNIGPFESSSSRGIISHFSKKALKIANDEYDDERTSKEKKNNILTAKANARYLAKLCAEYNVGGFETVISKFETKVPKNVIAYALRAI